jgi:hypothetical protein
MFASHRLIHIVQLELYTLDLGNLDFFLRIFLPALNDFGTLVAFLVAGPFVFFGLLVIFGPLVFLGLLVAGFFVFFGLLGTAGSLLSLPPFPFKPLDICAEESMKGRINIQNITKRDVISLESKPS